MKYIIYGGKNLSWLFFSTKCVAKISQDFIFWYQSWRHRRKTSLETTCSENSLSEGEWKKQKGACKRHKGLRGKQDWKCRPWKWQCKWISALITEGKGFTLFLQVTKGLISWFKSFTAPSFSLKGKGEKEREKEKHPWIDWSRKGTF